VASPKTTTPAFVPGQPYNKEGERKAQCRGARAPLCLMRSRAPFLQQAKLKHQQGKIFGGGKDGGKLLPTTYRIAGVPVLPASTPWRCKARHHAASRHGRSGNGWARSKGALRLGQQPGLVALGRVGQGDLPPVKSRMESYTTPARPPLAACAVHAPIDTAPAALRHPRGERTLQVA